MLDFDYDKQAVITQINLRNVIKQESEWGCMYIQPLACSVTVNIEYSLFFMSILFPFDYVKNILPNLSSA